MNPAQALARWLIGVSNGESALAEAKRKLEAHVANAPETADAAEHRRWLATKRELEDDVAAEEGALRIAEEKAAEAKRVAEKAEGDAEERRIQKLNDEIAKLTVEIASDSEKLKSKVQRHSDMLAEVAAWNDRRGERPYLVDGERRVRETPARDIPAVTRREKVWIDDQGNTPSRFVEHDGKLRPADGRAYDHREVEVVETPARHEPASMPARLAEAIRLVGLKGETLWPA